MMRRIVSWIAIRIDAFTKHERRMNSFARHYNRGIVKDRVTWVLHNFSGSLALASLQPTSSTNHTPYSLIGDVILSGYLAKWFTLVNTTKNCRPCRWRYLPVRIFWSWMTLGTRDNQRISKSIFKRITRRICIGRAWLRVVNKDSISISKELFKRDTCQVRPMVRCPSVPVGSAIIPKTPIGSWECLFLLLLLSVKRAVLQKLTEDMKGMKSRFSLSWGCHH